MTTSVWSVEGMTCGHCVSSVSHEISALPGVRDVQVVLETGLVTVLAETDPTVEDVAAAVDEAGYTLVTT